jgi:hypothetical protein
VLARYYNDLWAYDLEELRWDALGRPGANAPSPRGGCQLALTTDRLFLYGGHTITADKADGSELERVFDDLWSLDLKTFQVKDMLLMLQLLVVRRITAIL